MKTIDEVIAYLQAELNEAKEQHSVARGDERIYYLLKVRFITELLAEITR